MPLTDEDIDALERQAIEKMKQDAEAKLAAPGEVAALPPERVAGSVGALLGGIPKGYTKAGVVAYNREGKTQIDPRVHKALRDGAFYGTWAAKGWLGFVWRSDGRWFCEVWSKKIVLGTFNETDFRLLITICREKFGKE